MTKKICKSLILLFMLFTMFNIFTTNTKAIGFTDIGEINDGFMFNETKGSDDMKFTGAKDTSTDTFWEIIYDKYRVLILLVSAVLSLAFVGLFIINISKYGASAGNPQARGQAIKTLLWTGIGTALFGAVTLISAIGYTFLL